MLTYVTAFYPLRPGVDFFSQFKKLMDTGVPILLCTDPQTELPDLAPNVQRIPLALDIWTTDVVLPQCRNKEKDTSEYLWLMLMKLRCMKEALAYTEASHLAWIDFRVFHVVQETERVQQRLIALTEADLSRVRRIMAPGCWQPVPHYDIFNGICWRFCGGFFLGPRDIFKAAHARQTEIVEKYLPRITWEVNYWTYMEEFFEWYPADHNDSLILHFPYI